ncbi:MAG: serpin family protein, partial [Bacteroidaceae bacterium]|nr:serpin family protein [Bacteroidaceae bacterium]
GDSLVYARGLDGSKVMDEALLYDFRKSFEYGDEFHYASSSQAASVTLSRQTARIVYYRDILNEGEELPAWDNVVYKVGFLGNPMALYYQLGSKFFPGINYAPRVKPSNTNVSHIVFRPGGGRAKVLYSMRYEQITLDDQMNDFGFRLYQQMLSDKDEKANPNLVMSPVSAQMALSMLMNGAQGNTLREIREAMGLTDFSETLVNSYYHQLSETLWSISHDSAFAETTNGIWIQEAYPFQDEFFQTMQHYYDAEASEVNFSQPEAVSQINRWAEEKTHGLIKEVLNPNDKNAGLRMVLANALYFMGKWLNEKDVKEEVFHNSDNTESMVDMLCDELYGYSETERYKAVELYYGDKKAKSRPFSLLVILPLDPEDRRLITSEDYQNLMNSFVYDGGVFFRMPCFKVEGQHDLIKTLHKMGIRDAFTSQADFKRIAPSDLFVNAVKQLTSFHLDKYGTEAAAVTVIEGPAFSDISTNPPSKFYEFIADRPFQFVLQDGYHRIPLFIGQVNVLKDKNNPIKGKEEIEELPDSTRIAKSGFYDLQGRRVQGAPQKGVYIRHGRKFMKKATKRQ